MPDLAMSIVFQDTIICIRQSLKTVRTLLISVILIDACLEEKCFSAQVWRNINVL